MTTTIVIIFCIVYLGMILGGLPFLQLDRTVFPESLYQSGQGAGRAHRHILGAYVIASALGEAAISHPSD